MSKRGKKKHRWPVDVVLIKPAPQCPTPYGLLAALAIGHCGSSGPVPAAVVFLARAPARAVQTNRPLMREEAGRERMPLLLEVKAAKKKSRRWREGKKKKRSFGCAAFTRLTFTYEHN